MSPKKNPTGKQADEGKGEICYQLFNLELVSCQLLDLLKSLPADRLAAICLLMGARL